MNPAAGWVRSAGRRARLVVALVLDGLLVLVVAPVVVWWALLEGLGSLSGCEGVGCEGPVMVLFLVMPVTWISLAATYVVLSTRRWGRTPGMALLGLARRT